MKPAGTGTDTRERLLDAAERLFAARGFDGTSVRAITRQAKANLSAVNYHFESKVGLIRALMRRRFGPLNEERLRLLDEVERSRKPTVEDVLFAFLSPTARVWREAPHFIRLVGRVQNEQRRELFPYLLSQFKEVVGRYRAALARTLPRARPDEIAWHMHFMIGSMIHTWMGAEALEAVSGGRCRVGDGHEAIQRLVRFCAAGLRTSRPRGSRR